MVTVVIFALTCIFGGVNMRMTIRDLQPTDYGQTPDVRLVSERNQ